MQDYADFIQELAENPDTAARVENCELGKY